MIIILLFHLSIKEREKKVLEIYKLCSWVKLYGTMVDEACHWSYEQKYGPCVESKHACTIWQDYVQRMFDTNNHHWWTWEGQVQRGRKTALVQRGLIWKGAWWRVKVISDYINHVLFLRISYHRLLSIYIITHGLCETWVINGRLEQAKFIEQEVWPKEEGARLLK